MGENLDDERIQKVCSLVSSGDKSLHGVSVESIKAFVDARPYLSPSFPDEVIAKIFIDYKAGIQTGRLLERQEITTQLPRLNS